MALPADLINLATNPTAASTTGYAAIAGTGGTAALTNQVTAGYSGSNFNRTTWTVATSAVSGGQTYTQTGLTAATAYCIGVYVRASKAQTVNLSVAFQTSVPATVNTITSGNVAILANTWTRLAVVGTSGAAVDRAVLTIAAATGGTNWANTDTLDLDAACIQTTTITRTNLCSNPSFETNLNFWATNVGNGGAVTVTRPTSGGLFGGAYYRATWTTGNTASGYIEDSEYSGGGLTAGSTYTVSAYVRSSVATTMYARAAWYTNGVTPLGISSGSNTTVPANTWTRVSLTAVAPTGTNSAWINWVSTGTQALNQTIDVDGVLIEQSPLLGAYFDGSTPAAGTTAQAWTGAQDASTSVQGMVGPYFDGSLAPDSSYRYFWTGTANASTSHAEYRGVWVEVVTGPPCPRVQVTVSGLGTVAGLVQVTRTADGETWTVPGWYNRSVVDTDTDTDFAVPLGRNVTYTVFFNGAQVGQKSITVTSATGWVQSPYDPASAMPINTMLTDNAVLTLAKGSLDSRVHASNASKATVMGAKRQHSISGQRLVDGAAMFILHAWKNATSDQFKTMTQAPILLIRGLPSWGSIPGLAYTDAPAQEYAVSRYKNYPNDGLTQWVLGGDLVQPVSRKPLTGTVTNDQVQTNCAGVTYNTILARSGSKKNVDIKANPLGL